MSDAVFEKYEFGKQRKYKMLEMETFDPRPEKHRGKSDTRMSELLQRVKGKGLCISLLFDKSTQVRSSDELRKADMLKKVEQLKRATLNATEEEIRKIEFNTRTQHQSQYWYDIRSLRLTSSKFGLVRRLKAITPPSFANFRG